MERKFTKFFHFAKYQLGTEEKKKGKKTETYTHTQKNFSLHFSTT
jgi:hypothetical protein